VRVDHAECFVAVAHHHPLRDVSGIMSPARAIGIGNHRGIDPVKLRATVENRQPFRASRQLSHILTAVAALAEKGTQSDKRFRLNFLQANKSASSLEMCCTSAGTRQEGSSTNLGVRRYQAR
jgi:hypothetical protein